MPSGVAVIYSFLWPDSPINHNQTIWLDRVGTCQTACLRSSDNILSLPFLALILHSTSVIFALACLAGFSTTQKSEYAYYVKLLTSLVTGVSGC